MSHNLLPSQVDLWQRWIEALRSDKYQQGRHFLHRRDNQDKFCCLGVLCEVAKFRSTEQDDIVVGILVEYFAPDGYPADIFNATSTLGDAHLDYTGVTSDLQNTLVIMNDNQGASFREIADYLQGILDGHEPYRIPQESEEASE